MNLSNPAKSGLYATRNFYLKYTDPKRDREVSLGVWHVLPNHVVRRFARQLKISPETLSNLTISEEAAQLARLNEEAYSKIEAKFGGEFDLRTERDSFFEEILQNSEAPVIFYLHGNTASRGAPHRVELYQRLRQWGFHVIAFDYRGYGDSIKLGPTARAVILDSRKVFEYVVAQAKGDPILLWGHSLGTGIGTHLMAELQDAQTQLPFGVVLESPFNNIKEEITEHPFSKLYRNLPWFDVTIVNPMFENRLSFESDKHIVSVRQPVMILHAEDDRVVPFSLGYKLYRSALESRGKSFGPIEFHRFEKSSHFGHKHICRAPDLAELVMGFFNKFKNEKY